MEEGKIWSNSKKVTVDFSTSTKPLDYTRVLKVIVLWSIVAVAFLILYYASFNNDFEGQSFSSLYGLKYNSSSSSTPSSSPSPSPSPSPSSPLPLTSSVPITTVVVKGKYFELTKVLEAAATKEKTVILTTLNEAWAKPNSVYDLFLESFRVGNDTARLLDHLVVIAVDDDAYDRCKATVSHCYLSKNNRSGEMAHEAIFMTPIYMDMMWERLDFLQTILSLGYNFVFTDTDVMWFRNPLPHFTLYSDLQTSCDNFNGREFDLHNAPNNGFLFVRSNSRTIKFYKFWVSSRYTYPGLHEQNVFNMIKEGPFVKAIQLRIRFLGTDYFGGYCSPSRDFNKVCTMHANCCVGLDRKIDDLNTTIQDWKNYFHSNRTGSQVSHWRVPRRCRMF